MNNSVAVITGASSGIGAAIIEKLVDLNYNVVGLARRKEKLENLSKHLQNRNGKFYPFAADVSEEEDVLAAFQWIKEELGPVSILVNNAGVARVTNLTDGNSKFWKETFDTNVVGLCMCTREAVKSMRENKIDGHIVHINSVAGHRIRSHKSNVYPASKHAVTALTETLRLELNSIGSKIKISSVSPGLTKTDFFESMAKDSGLEEVQKERKEMLEREPMLQPEDVANAVVYVLSTPPHVQIHELIIKPIGEKA